MADHSIFALSSGAPPAGIAVIRLSGPGVRFGLETLTGAVPPPRFATLAELRHPRTGEPIDRGLVLYFAAPASFTGEDVAELQVHGGRAVVAALLAALSELPGFRPAEAGEFTRRAFENGRADLTEVEGLADLVAAETEMQRRMALSQAEGGLRRIYDGWRARLLRARALIEAELDFSEEDDVPGSVGGAAEHEAVAVAGEIAEHLSDGGWGERVRTGFEVVLVGPPNVGKSSLLNAMARRDAAIVTAEPGTTRDPIEVRLEIGGHSVTLVDTAGLREAESLVEREGVARSRRRAQAADLVLRLADHAAPPLSDDWGPVPVLDVWTKSDLRNSGIDSDSERIQAGAVEISALTGAGLGELRAAIAAALNLARPMPLPLVTRARQRQGLFEARQALDALAEADGMELKAERLRQAADGLARVTGRIDVEDWLGVIFSEFCIGK